jgi:isocitrate dehydrogenase (NAD+)
VCPSNHLSVFFFLFSPLPRTAANPSSQILSAVQMLAHLGEFEAAAKLEKALSATFASGTVPLDLGGSATTAQMTDSIVRHLDA